MSDQEIDIKEAVLTATFIQEAIINVLERKRIVKRTEIMDEIVRLKQKMVSKQQTPTN